MNTVRLITILALGLMAILFLMQVTSPLRDCPQSTPRREGIAVALAILLACMFLAGCKTAPEPVDRPLVACEPLTTCDIPPAANSTQLETALWGCLLEARAQYASCAGRSK